MPDLRSRAAFVWGAIHGATKLRNGTIPPSRFGALEAVAAAKVRVAVSRTAKSLHRILSQPGNPTMSNISAVFAAMCKRAASTCTFRSDDQGEGKWRR